MIIAELRPYPNQRKSTMPWLPSLPAHWSIRRAKTLFREIDRRTLDGRQPLLSLRMHAGLVDHHASGGKIIPPSALVGYKRVLPGELVMNRMRAAIGLFAGATTEGLVSPDYAVFQVEPTVSLPYAVHLFRTPIMGSVFRMESRGLGTGESGFLRLYSDRFGMLPIPLPPPSEQAAIVRFLNHANRRIDRFIRAKKKLIALLNEQKQAIIHRAVTRGLDLEEASPVVQRPVTAGTGRISWLKKVPDSWVVCPSGRLFVPRKELAKDSDEQLSATQAYGVILQSEYERRTGKRVVKISMHLERRRHVEKDDFVISMRSFQGGIERAWATGCIRSSYVVLRPCQPIDVGYYSYLLKSTGYIKALQATANFIRDGQDLNYENFRLVDLPVPPLQEQHAITEFLEKNTANLASRIENTRRELQLLVEYRTRLIADVVTGQLDVRDAVKELPVEDGDVGEPVDAEDEIEEAEIDDSDQDEAA